MRISVLFLVAILAGCGSAIQTRESLLQETGRSLSTHVGGQVLKVQRESDLPNAFGKADVFGGKVNRGFIELRYQGLAQDGRLAFRVTEIETESNETTMSRYGASTSTLNAQRVGNNVYGTVSTYSAPRGITDTLPPNTTQFFVDPAKTKEFTVGAVKIQILSADETSLSYRLTK